MAPAEDAYRTAIAVAEQQAARSPALQASLALANLYQSVGRPAEAKTVLALALELFCAHAGNARDRGGTGANGAFGVVPLRAEFCLLRGDDWTPGVSMSTGELACPLYVETGQIDWF